MRGKPVLISAATMSAFWPWLRAKFGFSDTQIRKYTYNLAPFILDPNAIQEGYLTSEPFTVQQQAHFTPKIFLLSDYGYPGYANMVLVPQKWIDGNRKAVQAFVDATRDGWLHYLDNPAKGNALIKRQNPDMTDAILKQALDKMKEHEMLLSGDGRAFGLGSMTDRRSGNAFYDTMASEGLYPKGLDYTKAYDLSFVPRHPCRSFNDRAVGSVAKRFSNGTQALKDLSFEIAAGEFVSCWGPAAAASPPRCGWRRACWRRMPGSVAYPGGKPEIGFVFQEPTLMPWADALTNARLPLDLKKLARGEANDRAAAALARVGLAGFERAYPRELSGGMKMRVSIARALCSFMGAAQPKLLLLDEPFAALDEITRNELGDDLLRLWREDGLTVLFVTHSAAESSYLAGRVLVMTPRPGRIAADIALPAGRDTRLAPPTIEAQRAISALQGAALRARRWRHEKRVPDIAFPCCWRRLLLGAWEWAVAHWQVPPYVLPAPSAIAKAFAENFGSLMESLASTLTVTLEAFAAATVLGVATGDRFSPKPAAGAHALSLCRDPAGDAGGRHRAADPDLGGLRAHQSGAGDHRHHRRLLSHPGGRYPGVEIRRLQSDRSGPALWRFARADFVAHPPAHGPALSAVGHEDGRRPRS